MSVKVTPMFARVTGTGLVRTKNLPNIKSYKEGLRIAREENLAGYQAGNPVYYGHTVTFYTEYGGRELLSLPMSGKAIQLSEAIGLGLATLSLKQPHGWKQAGFEDIQAWKHPMCPDLLGEQ